jgi:hypothetical protein
MISNSRSLRWSSMTGVAALLLAPPGLAAGSASPAPAQSRIKVLLVTGQSNRYHNWEVSSPIVARQLEDSGRFTVTVATTPAKGAAPNQDMSARQPAGARVVHVCRRRVYGIGSSASSPSFSGQAWSASLSRPGSGRAGGAAAHD